MPLFSFQLGHVSISPSDISITAEQVRTVILSLYILIDGLVCAGKDGF